MNDYIAMAISPDHIREWTINTNAIAAFFIGAYLAWASTPEASFRCFQTTVRMVHRAVLLLLALALMNNAMVLVDHSDGTGSTFAVFALLFISVLISAVRYRFWLGDVPADATWANPHFPHRNTTAQSAAQASVRRRV